MRATVITEMRRASRFHFTAREVHLCFNFNARHHNGSRAVRDVVEMD